MEKVIKRPKNGLKMQFKVIFVPILTVLRNHLFMATSLVWSLVGAEFTVIATSQGRNWLSGR